jgi:hypothetical protein
MENLGQSRGSGRNANLATRALGLAALVLIASCTRPSQGRDYAVRGLVQQIPTAGDPASGFVLRHEAIDGFVGRDGEASGMESMTMPFALARGVALDSVAVGDPVEIRLHVDWSADLPVSVTAIRELPAATVLNLGADPPANS